MRTLTRVTAFVVVAGVVLMVAFQLLGGPARYVIVSGRSMEPTLRSGDLVVLVKHASYRAGDVVAYHVPAGEPGAGAVVIHRVIGGSASAGYVTEGDNRSGRDSWRPTPDDVLGSMALQIPRAGHVPATFGSPMGLGICAGLFTFFLLTGGGRARPVQQPSQPGMLQASDDTVSAPVPAHVTAAVVLVGLLVLTVRAARGSTETPY